MVRYLKDQAFVLGKNYIEAAGLSTDQKPTSGIITGCRFLEVDTGNIYSFDEVSGTWTKVEDFDGDIENAVAAWLDDHPEATTTVEDGAISYQKLDSELKATVNDVPDLKSAIQDIKNTVYYTKEQIALISGAYINLSTVLHLPVDLTPVSSDSFSYAIIPCTFGDVFTVTLLGGNASRAYAILDANNMYIERADPNVTLTSQDITIPINGAKLVVNSTTASNPVVLKETFFDYTEEIQNVKESNDESITELKTEIGYYNKTITPVNGAYIDVSQTQIGSVPPLTPVENASFSYVMDECEPGDVYIITGTGGSSTRLYAYLRADYKLYTCASSGVSETDVEHVIPDGVYYIIVNSTTATINVRKKVVAGKDYIDDAIEESKEYAAEKVGETETDCNEYTDNAIEELSDKIGYYQKSIDFVEDYYLNTSVIGSTVNIEQPTPSTGWGYVIRECKPGDVFTLTGTGGTNSCLYASLDSTKKVLAAGHASSGETKTNYQYTAPVNAAYVVFNCNLGLDHKVETESIVDKDYIDEKATNSGNLFVSCNISGKKEIVVGRTIGAVVDTTKVDAYQWCCAIEPAEAGDVFRVAGAGGSSVPLWAFLSKDYKLVSEAETYLQTTAIEVTAPVKGYFVYNAGILTSDGNPYADSWTYAPIAEKKVKFDHNVIKKLIAGKYSKGTNVGDAINELDEAINEVSPASPYRRNGLNFGDPCLDGIYEAFGSQFSLFAENTQSDDYFDALETLVEGHEDYVTITTITNDEEDNPIYLYDLNPAPIPYTGSADPISGTGGDKMPKIIIAIGQHGYEKCSCYGFYYFLRDLLTKWDDDPIIRYLRFNVRLLVIPIVNRYGFDHVTYEDANNVNINRNYDYNFVPGGGESSGPSAFSEKGSQAVRTVVNANKDAFLFIDWHTSGYEVVPYMRYHNYYHINDIDTHDTYASRVQYALITYLRKFSPWFIKKYNIPNNGERVGHVAIAYPHQSTCGNWVQKVAGILTFTMETAPGLANGGTVLSADTQKANAEMIGNTLATMCSVFSKYYGT